MSNGCEHERLNINNCMFVQPHLNATANNATTKKRCIHTALHSLYIMRHTLVHCRALFFIWSLLACVCVRVFNFDTPYACYNYNYHYKRALNREVFEWERVSVCVTMIMWRVDIAKTHTHFILYIWKNENEWKKRKKVLQIVKWENE